MAFLVAWIFYNFKFQQSFMTQFSNRNFGRCVKVSGTLHGFHSRLDDYTLEFVSTTLGAGVGGEGGWEV